MSYPVIVAYGRTACTRPAKGGLHDVHPWTIPLSP